jgi:hypothetical protein
MTDDLETSKDSGQVSMECEDAYRRGLQQGAYLAVQAAIDGSVAAALAYWVQVDLYRWRWTERNKRTLPPAPPNGRRRRPPR